MPELVLESNGRTWTLDPSRSYTLGRDPQGDVVLDDARVSWRHATISFNGRSWVIEDHGSSTLSDEFYTWLVDETNKTLRKYI